jgi:hypothetical protein
MNKFKTIQQQDELQEKKSRASKPNKISRSILNIFSGHFLSKENVIRQLPFILFLTLMGLGYIANGYYAEKSYREISRVNSKLKELKSEYIIIKSELMYVSKQSEIARSVVSLGLKESTVPPKKIVVNSSSQ